MRKSFPLILTIFGATGSAVSLAIYRYVSSLLEPTCRIILGGGCYEWNGATLCGGSAAEYDCDKPEMLVYKVLVVGFIIITVVGLALLIRQRIRK